METCNHVGTHFGLEKILKQPSFFHIPTFSVMKHSYHYTEVHFASFLSGGFTTMAVINHRKEELGLDRTGHMSFLTGQDRTPKFAGQVLPDRTESGLIFLNILPNK